MTRERNGRTHEISIFRPLREQFIHQVTRFGSGNRHNEFPPKALCQTLKFEFVATVNRFHIRHAQQGRRDICEIIQQQHR